jgi:hypothetical protein
MTSRAQHLIWCKRRAREYLERGEARQAITSFLSDLGKHPETERAVDVLLFRVAMTAAVHNDIGTARRLIEGLR